MRRLLTRLVWTENQLPDFILYWSWWRRRHQARARVAITNDDFLICDCSIRNYSNRIGLKGEDIGGSVNMGETCVVVDDEKERDSANDMGNTDDLWERMNR